MNGSGTLAETRRLRLGPMAAAGCLLISTCSGYIEQQKVNQEEIKAADIALDRDRILVLTGDTDLPHDELGGLQYTEPFSAKANNQDHITYKLRTMAITKWGTEVDAIIDLQSSLSADATQLKVSAEAVTIKGPCSFCRHRGK